MTLLILCQIFIKIILNVIDFNINYFMMIDQCFNFKFTKLDIFLDIFKYINL